MEKVGQTLINSYYYVYGAGAEANRRIDFIRNSEKDSTLLGRVSANVLGKWIPTSTVTNSEMSIDLLSTSEKMKRIMMARQEKTSPRFETASMNTLPIEKQEGILKNLEPNGPLRITITNDVGGPKGLEKVVHLSIFNPS